MAKPTESPLMRIIEVASALGAAPIADEAFELADRIAEGRFFCACIGQYKRGKSTFVNALLGHPILPSGVVPVTSTVTIIQHAKRRAAQVRFINGSTLAIAPAELVEYVAEDHNPANAKGVAAVELFWPSPLLKGGLCLVDTPGISSVHEWNTDVTRGFLPQMDAALVILGADPPISKDELDLVEEVFRQTRSVVFVLNKADRLTTQEQDESIRFTERVLASRLGVPGVRVHRVSATERLYRDESTREWPAMEKELRAIIQESGKDLISSAQARGLSRMVAVLKEEIDERVKALRRPVGEAQTRLAALHREVLQAEQALQQLLSASQSDRARLDELVERAREAFLGPAVTQGRAELEPLLRESPLKGSALREHGLEAARRIAGGSLEEWTGQLSPQAEQVFREASERLLSQAQVVLKKLSSSASKLPRVYIPEGALQGRVELDEALPEAPEAQGGAKKLAGELFRSEAARRALSEELGGYLERLLSLGSTRIADRAKERAQRMRQQLEEELNTRLGQISGVAKRALSRARDRQQAGTEAVRQELEHLDRLIQKLSRI